MIQFEYTVLIRGFVHMSVLLCVHQKREAIRVLRLPVAGQGSTPPLTNFLTYPLSFSVCIICNVTSRHVPAG